MKLSCNVAQNAKATVAALLKLKGRVEGGNFIVPFLSHGQAWRLFYQAKQDGVPVDVDAHNTILINVGKWCGCDSDFWVELEVKPSAYSRRAGVDLSKPLRQTRFSLAN